MKQLGRIYTPINTVQPMLCKAEPLYRIDVLPTGIGNIAWNIGLMFNCAYMIALEVSACIVQFAGLWSSLIAARLTPTPVQSLDRCTLHTLN